tara:strand:- start:47 stop:316 length:270 start_codon:yes stop_codon:yes gene_type:complete
MIEDIVARLRGLADCDARAGEPLGKCMREAAAEIERLREELAQLHEEVKPSVLDCTEYCFEECQRGIEPIENCACFKVGVAIAVRERNT